MGVVKSMIILEDVLEEIFSYLPPMKYKPSDAEAFNVTFSHGDKKELNAFLKHKHKGPKDPYPLIWLMYPYEEIHRDTHLRVNSLSLVLAVNTNNSMQNKQRLAETYKQVLFPLYDNIVHCFKMANIVNVAHEYRVVKYPNYSDEESISGSHGGAFRWDALKMTFGISIQDTCLKPIKFK